MYVDLCISGGVKGPFSEGTSISAICSSLVVLYVVLVALCGFKAPPPSIPFTFVVSFPSGDFHCM